jgi:4-amino-4-deoxy-L-arabinose transferase-like glycosyltransferase
MQKRKSFSADGLRHQRRWPAYVFGVALLLRLTVLGFNFPGNGAVAYYDDAKIALNLVEGKGYSINYEYRNWLFYETFLKTARLQEPVTSGTKPTGSKQPAYPLFLAGLFYCFGVKNFFAVFLINAIISSLTVSLLFLCLRSSAPVIAVAVALAVAIYPPFVFHSVTVPESTTLLLLLIAALWLWLTKIRDGASWYWWLLGGGIGGLTILTEPVTLPVVSLGLCYGACLDGRKVKRRSVGVVLAVVMVLLVLSPWLVRNFLVFNRFPVLKTVIGVVFNWGLHFSGTGSWLSEDRLVALELAGRNVSELEEDEAIRRELWSLLPSHWHEYLFQDIPLHFVHFWWEVPRNWSNYSLSYLMGRRIPYLALLGLAFPQLLLTTARLLRCTRATLHNAVPEVSALLVIATYTLVYGVFGAYFSRYRFPVELGLLVLAGNPLVVVVANIRKRYGIPGELVSDTAPSGLSSGWVIRRR